MFVLVLKILGPVFLFGVSIVSEWSMLRDKSTRQRAALVLGMGAVVTIAAAIGLVIDHNIQAAKLTVEQKESAALRKNGHRNARRGHKSARTGRGNAAGAG